MSPRVVLSSEDGNDYFSNNTSFDFRVKFNKRIEFEGYWVVAVTEFTTTDWDDDEKSSELFVFSDICQDTFIGQEEGPLLRKVYLGNKKQKNIIYNYPYYIPIKVGGINQIHIYIKDSKGKDASFLRKKVSVTLHFKKFPFIF